MIKALILSLLLMACGADETTPTIQACCQACASRGLSLYRRAGGMCVCHEYHIIVTQDPCPLKDR